MSILHQYECDVNIVIGFLIYIINKINTLFIFILFFNEQYPSALPAMPKGV